MHTPTSNKSFNTTRFSIMSDIAALEEFHKILEEIANPQLQQKMQQAMNNILVPWTQRQDDMIHTLNQVEQSYTSLQQDNQVQSTMYHKAIRDLQFYKTKCDILDRQYNVNKPNNSNVKPSPLTLPPMDPRSLPHIDTSSNISFTTTNSSTDYSHNTKSSDDYSSISFSNPFLYPTPDHFELLSVIDQQYHIHIPPQKPPPSIDLPLPPIPDSSSPSHKNSMTTTQRSHFETPPISTEELSFGCGDGFWHTIAKGKSNKNGVKLLIETYLQRGGTPNVANNSGTIHLIKEGYGLIHALIVVKNTSALQRIIEAGANPHVLPLQTGSPSDTINDKENDNISPLVLAAQLGYLNGVRLLVERAHVNVLSSKGPRQENALLAAILANAFDVATYLLQVSYQLLDQADIFGATPLHYACMTGKTKMISYLVRECGQSPDATDYKGETPLHYAIRHRRTKAIVFLVSELDVYPNAYVIKKVPTPLDLAKAKGLRSIADFLKKMGAKTAKEMEKKSSSVFTNIGFSSSSSDTGSTTHNHNNNNNESCVLSLTRSNYSIHSIHSGRTNTSNESAITG